MSFASPARICGWFLSGVLAFLGTVAPAQQTRVSVPIFPLSEIKPGMKAVGLTVFDGRNIEEFQAEILGVLRNVSPRQSVILARLSGGPLEETGVLAGMSGSPVYIDGRLIGAVALGFPVLQSSNRRNHAHPTDDRLLRR